jgi:hypothetical protein
MTAVDPLFATIGRMLDEQDRDPRLPWHDDPSAFARECINWPEGTSLAPYQANVLGALPMSKRVAVRSLHGVGKSAMAALLILWFAITRDAAGVNWKILTTAGGNRQLNKFLWPEIHLWSRRIRWDLIGREPFDPRKELLTTMLRLSHGEAFAAASDDPQLLEGAHADALLVVLDESKSIVPAVWDSVEGALSGTGETFAYASSTPGAPSGRFFEIHERRPGLQNWETFHIKLADAVGAGRVREGWADEQAFLWGSSSPMYLNRVLGEFADSEQDGVIPLSWVEAAVDRWHTWKDAGAISQSAPPTVGVDVGRGGDKSVIALLRGSIVEFIEPHNTPDLMDLVGNVLKYAREPGCHTIVDVIGIGGGVVDRLREVGGVSVEPFNASHASTRRDRSGAIGFRNRRAEAWWWLREALDPNFGSVLAIPDNEELIGDLCGPRYSHTSQGQLQIEGKDEIKKRLGRSPDAGDSLVMACTRYYGRSSRSSAASNVSAVVQWSDMADARSNGYRLDNSFPAGRPDWTYKERNHAEYLTAGSPW